MKNICVIGLGSMGAALARAIARNQGEVTVWNRTPAKADLLSTLGARPVKTVSRAAQESDVLIVCVKDYRAATEILRSGETASYLGGKTVIQLGTGLPGEATALRDFLHPLGARYLDGAILGYPRQIGTGSAAIFVSGPSGIFAEQYEILQLFGRPTHVGESIGGACALDISLIVQSLMSMLGYLQGAAMCEVEGIDLDAYTGALLPLGDEARRMADQISGNDFAEPECPLGVWAKGWNRVVDYCDDNGISSATPRFMDEILQRAVTAGFEQQELASLINVLRPGRVK